VFIPPDKFKLAVWDVQFHVKFENACPKPVGAVEFEVYPTISQVEPAFQVAVGIVPAVEV
jgi:hypothetical protein